MKYKKIVQPMLLGFAAFLIFQGASSYFLGNKKEFSIEDTCRAIEDAIQAIYANDIDKLQSCLNSGARADLTFNWNFGDDDGEEKIIQNLTLLHIATSERNLAAAKLLIQHNAPLEAQIEKQETPLHIAAQGGDIEMAKLFIENNANIAAKTLDGLTPLHFAIEGGHTDMVKLLEKHLS